MEVDTKNNQFPRYRRDIHDTTEINHMIQPFHRTYLQQISEDRFR